MHIHVHVHIDVYIHMHMRIHMRVLRSYADAYIDTHTYMCMMMYWDTFLGVRRSRWQARRTSYEQECYFILFTLYFAWQARRTSYEREGEAAEAAARERWRLLEAEARRLSKLQRLQAAEASGRIYTRTLPC